MSTSKKNAQAKEAKARKKEAAETKAPIPVGDVDPVIAAGIASDHPREEGDPEPKAVKKEDLRRNPVQDDADLEKGKVQLWAPPYPATGLVQVLFASDITGIGIKGSVAIIPAEVAQANHRHLKTPKSSEA